MSQRHIIAMGGGGFSMEPDDWPLGQYVLRHAPKTDPAACFLPTVSGDSDGYIVRFYVAEDP